MRRGLGVLAGVVMGVAAAGCSSNNTYTCNFSTTVGLCYEWSTSSSLSSSEVTALQEACTGSGLAGASFTTGGSCPSTNRVGLCTLNFPASGYSVTYQWAYYSPTFTAANGQTACAAEGGTWTAG